jgi:hypothetical protein
MMSTRIDIVLAINGVLILGVSLIAGLLLYRALLRKEQPHDWHLLHAGGSGRGVMLLALAAIIDLPQLPEWLLWSACAAIVFFAWASTIAMVITGLTGERGFRQEGPPINRVAHALYVAGAAAVFPGVGGIAYGLVRALIS